MGGGVKLRVLVIGDQIWRYNIRERDVRIFAPNGVTHEVKHWDMLGITHMVWSDRIGHVRDDGFMDLTIAITPALIKKFILGLKEIFE